jgi:hypothetical protein
MNPKTYSTTGTRGHGGREKVALRRSIFRIFLSLCACVAALGLSSCAEVAKDMGLDQPTDVEQRSGLTGTSDNPATLDPFQQYDLVMAANETRFFQLKVPSGWFWKVYLTAANRDDTRHGHLWAQIAPSTPQWQPLIGAYFAKSFDLGREGEQTQLAVGNDGPARYAVLVLRQQGAPLHITLQSQVSATKELMGPDDFAAPTTDQ